MLGVLSILICIILHPHDLFLKYSATEIRTSLAPVEHVTVRFNCKVEEDKVWIVSRVELLGQAAAQLAQVVSDDGGGHSEIVSIINAKVDTGVTEHHTET